MKKERWTQDGLLFADSKRNLVGDCALGAAFVCYCGTFDQMFRNKALELYEKDLHDRKIAKTNSYDLVQFLSRDAERSEWNVQGLPTNIFSVQNGILVTQSPRFPLLIDPQGQGLSWIVTANPEAQVLSMEDSKLRDRIEFAMAEGTSVIISNVGEEIDPMLDPVFERQIITKAKSKYIKMGDKLCEFNENFQLYLTTRLRIQNFHLSFKREQ